MTFVDLMLSRDCFDSEMYITHGDVVSFTGLSNPAVSNNLSVCVKNGYLRRVEINDGTGRHVRYYLAVNNLNFFIDKFLR